jgi:hypothetical protein
MKEIIPNLTGGGQNGITLPDRPAFYSSLWSFQYASGASIEMLSFGSPGAIS